MKSSRLEDDDWATFKQQFARLAGEVIQRARIIACTPAVVDSELLKAKHFDDIVNDETSVTTALEALTAWRGDETFVMVGDDNQLKPPVFTGSEESPFYKTMEYSPFARFRDLDMPAFLLTDQMLMPAGLMHMSNTFIYYGGKLRDGLGTALKERPKAQDLKVFVTATYPSLQAEPEDLIYPVMLNVHGESTTEGKGTSIFNVYNVEATLEEIIKLIHSHPHANASNVGIATPYRAQIRKYRRGLIKASQQHPDMGLQQIRLGAAEYWQGDELSYMFVDLVRASNDAGTLGFVSDARRLNVLITRQTIGLWIICDERCVLTLGAQVERDNPIFGSSGADAKDQTGEATEEPKVKKSQEDQRNATVIAMFAWMREKGRVVNIPKQSLTEKYVAFPATEDKKDQVPLGWVDKAASDATETVPPVDKEFAEWKFSADESLLEGDRENEGGAW